MKTLNKAVLMLFMISAIVAIIGCKGEGGDSSVQADLGKSIETIKSEAAKMDVETLKAKAVQFKNAIMSKESQVNELMEKMKVEGGATKLIEEKNEITAELEALMNSIKDLKVRYDVYMGYLIEKKADITGLSLS